MKGMNTMKAVKTGIAGLLLAVLLAGAGLVASSPSTQPTSAAPIAMVGLNSSICITLAAAFGGLAGTDAISDCQGAGNQNGATTAGSLEHFVACLRGADFEHVGVHECLNRPGDPLVGKVTPKDLAGLDLDKNQFYTGQSLIVFAFVNDDTNVRFKTDFGQMTDTSLNTTVGTNYFCNTGDRSAVPPGDPDCDGNPATPGDGVVVAAVKVTKADGTGTGTVTAIQNGIGFPMTFTVTGTPQTITVKPLFGKDTIQTGATVPPKASDLTALPLPHTDCSFQASAAAVLGANNDAVKAVLVAAAQDNDGLPVVGALLQWNHPFVHSDGLSLIGQLPADPVPQGGVALAATPTIDTGPLGISFPQFVCGGSETGDLKEKVSFVTGLDGGGTIEREAFTNVVVHVVGPPSTVTLAADPPVVDCNGTNSSKVTATVSTAAGLPVADGVDVNFRVDVLGTANPLVTNSGKGAASTTVTPFASGNGATGVPVVVTAGDVQTSILVQCSGAVAGAAAPPPAPGAPGGGTAPAAGGGPTGTITGPDTGSGGAAGGQGALSWWPVLALAAGAVALTGVRFAVKRAD